MPFIKAKTSCPISDEQETELKARMGKAIELVPGKSEEYLLLEFEDNCRLWLRGDSTEPISYIEATVFGNEPHYGYDAFTAEITSIFADVLKIHPDRIHLKYDDIAACRCAGRVHRQGWAQVIVAEDKIVLTAFTDPMMGLSYESEPIMDRLKREYGERIEFRYVMSLLVRDVSDSMTPEERAMGPEAGIHVYCERLAGVYKSEESVDGLPINMDGFRLFDTGHRSSKPLDLAYKAAQLADSGKADAFLTEIRHATVIDCFPTTHFDEILNVVRKVGIDEASFESHYQDGSAEGAYHAELRIPGVRGCHRRPDAVIRRRGGWSTSRGGRECWCGGPSGMRSGCCPEPYTGCGTLRFTDGPCFVLFDRQEPCEVFS